MWVQKYHTKIQVGDNVRGYGKVESLSRTRGLTVCKLTGGRDVSFGAVQVSVWEEVPASCFYERIAETSPWC